MAKYTTITEIAKAFRSRELDETYVVEIDKGGCQLSLSQSGPEEKEEERYDHCQELFDREYGPCVEELLALAGIPCRGV